MIAFQLKEMTILLAKMDFKLRTWPYKANQGWELQLDKWLSHSLSVCEPLQIE